MKDWTKEVEIYTEKIKGMEELDAYQFLWDAYMNNDLSKRAHDWLVMWL